MEKRSYSEYYVMKFGGSSVGTPERIIQVAKLIGTKDPKVVVLSAMGGVTNMLVEISGHYRMGNVQGALMLIDQLAQKYAETIDGLYKAKESKSDAEAFVLEKMDFLRTFQDEAFTDFEEKQVLAIGEMISIHMMWLYLRETGRSAAKIPALDYMCTDKYGEPDLTQIGSKLRDLLARHPEHTLFLTEGYICRNAYAEVDNLKRGGSDYTASLVGAVLDAREIQIWTDIDGLHNNDPRIVNHTEPVHKLHFSEAAELAYFGAKILHPSCILPAQMANIPVRILNTMDPSAEGTLISNRIDEGDIKAVAVKDGITALRVISNRRLVPLGFLRKVFETFERHQTPIDVVATSEVAVSLGIDSTRRLEELLAELRKFSTVSVDEEMSIICIAGDLNWKNTDKEGDIVKALEGIPIRMITYGGSNHNVSVLIRTQDKEQALLRLNDRLFGFSSQQ